MAWVLTGTRSAKSVQGGAEPDPSSAADGIALDSIRGFSVLAECDDGQTFSGAGFLEAFYYDTLNSAWFPAPDLNLSITGDSTGKRRVAWVGFEVGNTRGRLAWKRNGVTVSSGNVTIYVNCTNFAGSST